MRRVGDENKYQLGIRQGDKLPNWYFFQPSRFSLRTDLHGYGKDAIALYRLSRKLCISMSEAYEVACAESLARRSIGTARTSPKKI